MLSICEWYMELTRVQPDLAIMVNRSTATWNLFVKCTMRLCCITILYHVSWCNLIAITLSFHILYFSIIFTLLFIILSIWLTVWYLTSFFLSFYKFIIFVMSLIHEPDWLRYWGQPIPTNETNKLVDWLTSIHVTEHTVANTNTAVHDGRIGCKTIIFLYPDWLILKGLQVF